MLAATPAAPGQRAASSRLACHPCTPTLTCTHPPAPTPQEGDGKVLSPAQSAASGFVAACIGPTLNNPFDVVKTRM